MSSMPDTLWLAEIRKEDIPSVGGKGASLGEMTSVGLPVPSAFVITAQAFRRFLVESGIEEKIFGKLKGLDVENAALLEKTANEVKKIVLKAEVPKSLSNSILSSYKKMGKDVVVAVRSSATAEDLPDASFAGQQDTYLNIKGEKDLMEAVRKCWASLYGGRAIYYRAKQGFDDSKVDIAVVIQKLVYSQKAGVMFSSDPVTGAKTTIIEASWGLGEAIVSGLVSPDNYKYSQAEKKVVNKYIANKIVEIVPDGNNGTKEVKVEKKRQDAVVLSDTEIDRLAKFAKISEEHYECPQDMEWGIVDGEIYILQSRPITTIKENAGKPAQTAAPAANGKILLEGQGASPGVASGPVVIVNSVKDLVKVKDGDIMVAKMTNPDMVPAMRKSVAIITDEGGMTCHAAIVSRELGTPAAVGTKKATKILKDGVIVTVDGEKGLVFEGASAAASAPAQAAAPAGAVIAAAPQKIITATSIKVNVSLPEAAKRAAATGADGVGLLRIEHLILGLGKTPNWYIVNKKEDEFINELYTGIKTVMDAFNGKPVWVRTLDAPTDEFRNMKGGDNEPIEHNPMLGWRGIRRDLQSRDQFRLQVEAFKRLWAEGYDNLGIMFPLVGHPKEFIAAKNMMAEFGVDVEKRTLGVMVEIPSSVILIEDFIAAGIKFCSFGTNDLIQYTLAIDRNNQNVADMYNPQHPAVLKLIKYAIDRCRKAGVECSICGQAGSDPEMVKWLIKTGITSVSANIDAIAKIRETAAKTEAQIVLDAARLRLE